MVQEKQPFSVLYVGCTKNLRAVLLAGTTSKGKREAETLLYGNAGCEL